jgi:phosphate starvation-inducible PhoH-like protein
MYEATLNLAQPDQLLALFGSRDQNLRLVRDALSVAITHRDGCIRVSGDEPRVIQAADVLEQLKQLVQREGTVTSVDVQQVLALVTGDDKLKLHDSIEVLNPTCQIRPRTNGQARYVRAIADNDVTFALGPAGTGKTFLAVAMAVQALKHQAVEKIVLVRPAVEAGESLGYLPGDLNAKINPYLRPLLDALHSMIDYEQIKQLMDRDVIEVIPLAYMRGRTLENAFIILDEAQNTTIAQMKMFLTRMGTKSRIVASGDTTQVDLPRNTQSGLVDAVARLEGIDGVAQVRLSGADIVRHKIVQKIVEAYEKQSGQKQSR